MPSAGHVIAGLAAAGYIPAPFSPTMRSAYAQRQVSDAMAASGNWVQIAPAGRGMQGLGAAWTDSIPTWAPWLAGGLVLAGIAGFFVFRKKR